MKAIGIIGFHHTGKTTLAVAVINALRNKNFSVSSIKDIHNENYRADNPNTNSWLHAQAGAENVFACGTRDTALIFPTKLSLYEMLPHLSSEFLIIEGMKDAAVPKIVCADNEDQLEELLDDTCIGISGRIADKISSYKGIKVFCLSKDLDALIQTIIERSFSILPNCDPLCCSACGTSCYQMARDIVQKRRMRSDCVLDGSEKISLRIGNKEIPIVPFVQNLLYDNILAFIHNLKGVDPDGSISISINPKKHD